MDYNQSTEIRYSPWGQTRYTFGTPTTDRKYTGQREEAALGLYYYNARWYDPALSHFIMADTIIPGAGNPQAWDRYAYTLNNPIRFNDPTGHKPAEDGDDDPEPKPTPPITVDDEMGVCINWNNVGCSGTVESNIEWMEWSISMLPHEYDRRWNSSTYMNYASTILQDGATTVSSIGAAVETSFIVAGSGGGWIGMVAGWALGSGIYSVVFNPIETGLSGTSTLAGIRSDVLAGKTSANIDNGILSVRIGETTATGMSTAIAGTVIPEGIIDAGIDNYATEFSHGNMPGVLSWSTLSGQTLNAGPVSIHFGNP